MGDGFEIFKINIVNLQAGGEGISGAIALVCINSVSELLRYRRVEVEWAGGSVRQMAWYEMPRFRAA